MAPYNIVVFAGDYCGPEVSYLLHFHPQATTSKANNDIYRLPLRQSRYINITIELITMTID